VGLKPVLRTTTSFSALTLSVGSFDLYKPVPDMTYHVFCRTLNPIQSVNHEQFLKMSVGLGLVFVNLFRFVFWFSVDYFVLVLFASVVLRLVSSVLSLGRTPRK